MKTSDTDVLIIGAGVAGLSAAQEFKRNNIDINLIEGSHRIGGRAYSERLENGSWFDLGCSYLHEGEINPFCQIAHRLGFRLGQGNRFDEDKLKITINGKKASIQDYNLFHELESENIKVMNKMAHLCGPDDMASAIDWEHRFSPLLSHLMSGLNASDVTDQSVIDYLKSGFGLNYPVSKGLGSLVLAWAEDFLSTIPYSLNCTVTEIDWKNHSVRVKTSQGQINAKKVLITVSTGVINSGVIKFNPILPTNVAEAFSNLPCGSMNKIGISFTQNTFSSSDSGWHNNFTDEGQNSPTTGSFDINIDEQQQAIIFLGGSESSYLEEQGANALHAYALDRLISVFGSDIKRQINGHIATAWGRDPLTFGSYSYARPSHSNARQVVRQSINNCLYFSGEATSLNHYGTCHGAYFSGIENARKIITELGVSNYS